MSLKMVWKVITIVFFVLAFVQLCFINTEFSIADNCDFPRYLSFLEKPCSLSKNRPAAGTSEWPLRFFSQPQMYWNFRKTPQKSWFTSAHLFWNCGKIVNQWFFCTKVFSMKYAGFLHYLIHTLALAVFFVSVLKKQKWSWLTVLPILLLSVDALFGRFYNSFYAESVMILFLQCLMIYVAWLAFFSEDSYHWENTFLYTLFIAFMAILAGISKRQYLPFCLITALFAVGIMFHAKYGKKDKILKGSIAIVILLSVVCAILVWFANVDTGGQKTVGRVNNYHALYYGILVSSEHPEALIQKLNLPKETIKCVGRSYWSCPKEGIPVRDKITQKQVVFAFVLDPMATLKSYYKNLSGLSQFQTIRMGSIPHIWHKFPPAATAVYSSSASHFSGEKIFFVACGLAILLCIFSFGLDSSHHNILRAFLMFFFMLAMLDVAVSLFDGGFEVTKHIMVANFCIEAVYALFLAALGNFLHQIIDRKIHIPFSAFKNIIGKLMNLKLRKPEE